MMNGEDGLKLKKLKGFDLLYEVSCAITSNCSVDDILVLVVGMTAELMGSKICSLMLLDEEKQELVIKATQSLSPHYRTKPPIKVGESLIGRVIREKMPLTVSDVRVEKGYQYPELARSEGLCSLAVVPMMIKNRVIGVLNCYTSEKHDFSTEEIQLLAGVANQAAIAIENTHLSTEKKTAVEALETRKRVERAKGILMKRHPMNEAEAYRMIQKQSMEKRHSLKDIAEAIILSEEILS